MGRDGYDVVDSEHDLLRVESVRRGGVRHAHHERTMAKVAESESLSKNSESESLTSDSQSCELEVVKYKNQSRELEVVKS